MQQEKKFDFNQIIAFVLMGLLLFGVMYWNTPSDEEVAQQKKEFVEKEQKAKIKAAQNTKQAQALFEPISGEAKNVEVKNSKINVVLSPKGGQINSVKLLDYKAYTAADNKDESPLFLVKEGSNSLNFTFKSKNGADINTKDLIFIPSVQKNSKNTIVTMTAQTQGGQIQYIYTVGDSYGIDLDIKSQGLANISGDDNVVLSWKMDGITTEKGKQQEKYWAHTYYQFEDSKDIEYTLFGSDEWEEEEAIDWVANKQQFFATVLSSKEGFKNSKGGSLNAEEDDAEYCKHYFFTAPIELKNNELNQQYTFDYLPLDYYFLKDYNDKGFKNLIDFGWGIFGALNTYFFLPVFAFLAKFGIELGWVIFLMTIVVKLILSPITYKQNKQSALMKVLRPELNEINEKFKDSKDAMKKQQATMEIYRNAGVNPLAGCLPALLQIPIFYALFRFFPNLIELRGVPFLFAEDLTAFDSLIILPEWVPLLNGHLSIFAMLYIVAMMVYFKVSGSMDNFQMPQQEGMPNMEFMKYMMYIMPIFFFVFLNNYASGLSWYYLVSNTINIGIVLYIKKVMINETKIHQILAENKSKPKKEGKFASRMQDMMKKAQEMQENQDQNKKNRK